MANENQQLKNKIQELQEILENYSNKNPDYLNAQKYLLDFEINHLNKLSLKSFQVKFKKNLLITVI